MVIELNHQSYAKTTGLKQEKTLVKKQYGIRTAEDWSSFLYVNFEFYERLFYLTKDWIHVLKSHSRYKQMSMRIKKSMIPDEILILSLI